jgi:phage tail-like protein
MASYYPPSAFYFRVQLDGGGASATPLDQAFQDASGLSVDMEPETVAEGGVNNYRHRLPVAAKYGDLVLKRGFVLPSAPLYTWCQQTLQAGLARPIETKSLVLQLLAPGGNDGSKIKILRQWSFAGAWPMKWALGDFDAQKNEVLIETLQFAYRYFTRS